jgi:hypothetical protein
MSFFKRFGRSDLRARKCFNPLMLTFGKFASDLGTPHFGFSQCCGRFRRRQGRDKFIASASVNEGGRSRLQNGDDRLIRNNVVTYVKRCISGCRWSRDS